MIDGVVATLRAAGYDAALFAERPNFFDAIIKGYPLTDQCVEESADIVVAVPSTFVRTPPYGFFAMTPITRRSGSWRNTSRAAPYSEATFFSRNCHGWDPGSYDILTFLTFLNQWISA